MMLKKAVTIITIIVLLLSVISCTNNVYAPAPDDSPKLGDFKVSEGITAEIYYDATPSMIGYVNPGEATSYGRTMQVLENSIIKGWSTQNVTYYKFGTKIEPINRYESLRAKIPAFYNDPGLSLETHIDQVIDKAVPENLTIIVTDLFQNDADINLLVSKIKEKYIANSLAVGVVGFRSEFTGKLYDIGINRYTYTYDSGAEPEKFRPFYLLILGKPGDIINYFNQLEENDITGKLDSRFLLVTSQTFKNPATFKGAVIEKTDRLNEISNIMKPGLVDERVKQFLIRKKDTRSSCNIKLKNERVPYTPDYDNDKITTSIKVSKLTGDKFIEDQLLNESLVIDSLKLQGQFIEIGLVFDSSRLQAGKYSYHISIRPEENAYIIPEWVYDWNMDTSQIEKWNKDPSTFDETTTLNLEPFISGLCQSSTQFNKTYSDIADIYFYIDKK